MAYCSNTTLYLRCNYSLYIWNMDEIWLWKVKLFENALVLCCSWVSLWMQRVVLYGNSITSQLINATVKTYYESIVSITSLKSNALQNSVYFIGYFRIQTKTGGKVAVYFRTWTTSWACSVLDIMLKSHMLLVIKGKKTGNDLSFSMIIAF